MLIVNAYERVIVIFRSGHAAPAAIFLFPARPAEPDEEQDPLGRQDSAQRLAELLQRAQDGADGGLHRRRPRRDVPRPRSAHHGGHRERDAGMCLNTV